jgi:hypothetical protein
MYRGLLDMPLRCRLRANVGGIGEGGWRIAARQHMRRFVIAGGGLPLGPGSLCINRSPYK